MSTPTEIGKQLLDHITAQYGAASIAGVSALYSADSVAIFEGNAFTGADIGARIVSARLAGGPVGIRWSSFSAQFTSTGQCLIAATGESTSPAGRFSEIFVLNANPAGGFYIKADIARWSVGPPNEAHYDQTGMGKGFVTQYLQMYSSNRAQLASVYHDSKSQLTFEGQAPLVGRAAIVAKLPELPPGTREHDTCDSIQVLAAAAPGAAPAGPAVVALVTGRILLEGQTNPLAYMQAFFLAVEGGQPFCANEIFYFNYA